MTGTASALSVDRVLGEAAFQVVDVEASPRRREALTVLVGALREASLSPQGVRLTHRELVHLVVTGARLDRAPARPEPPEPPIVIASTPRSGSTLLHHLLALDPDNRTLPFWEAKFPVPMAPDDTGARRRAAAATVRALHMLRPQLADLHPMGADLPEECIVLMAHQLESLHFVWHYDVPEYAEWYLADDGAAGYHGLRRALRRLDPGPCARWVLKSFCHALHAETLAAAFPDATVVSLRRDPVAYVPSLCLLTEVSRSVHSLDPDRTAIGRDVVRVLTEGVERFDCWRAQADDDRVVDLDYRSLVADPLGAVATIYERAGAVLTRGARESMQAWLHQHHWRRRTSSYRYALADYGLSTASVQSCGGQVLAR